MGVGPDPVPVPDLVPDLDPVPVPDPVTRIEGVGVLGIGYMRVVSGGEGVLGEVPVPDLVRTCLEVGGPYACQIVVVSAAVEAVWCSECRE